MPQKKAPKKGVQFKIEMKMHDVVKDLRFPITKLGEVKVHGTLVPRTAQIVADAIFTEDSYLHPLEAVIYDLLKKSEGGPSHMTKMTGLPMERCIEIYQHFAQYDDLVKSGKLAVRETKKKRAA